MPVLSVLIPCYNQKRTLAALLSSMEKQSLGLDEFELVVTDDGSTDGSVELLKEYRGPLQLKPVLNPHNGRAAVRNRGLDKADGKYLLFLDGDMIAHPKLLETHLRAQEKTRNAVFVGTPSPAPGREKDILALYRAGRGPVKVGPGKPLRPKYFATNNCSLPLPLLRAAGPFNECYTVWGGEDREMGYRLAEKGAVFYYLPDAVSYHDHPETITDYLQKVGDYARTGLPFLVKNCPADLQQGYMALFSSRNPGIRFLLRLFFQPVSVFIAKRLVRRVPCNTLAFLLLDYLTYSLIYSGLKRVRAGL